MRLVRLGLACLGLVLVAAALGVFGYGVLQEVLWGLCVLGGSVLLVGASVTTLRKRIREKTLGRLVRALIGTALAMAVLIGMFIAIDRLVVDLKGIGSLLIFPALFALGGVYTFYRLDRSPDTTPEPTQ